VIPALDPPRLEEIEAARGRIRDAAVRTPLLRLDLPDAPCEIHVKLENLQPIGSFKIRGATNAIRLADPAKLQEGVYTASAGNMAQGVAWSARAMGIPCTAVVPDTAPETKLDAITRLGGSIRKVPFAEWWRVIEEHGMEGVPGVFIHPVADRAVVAGNGTIGLEILEDLPDMDAVLVPFGGGGLISGIASAVLAKRPQARAYACEVETAAPLAASIEAGAPRSIRRTPSFVDGIGGSSVLPEMWPMLQGLVDGSLVVDLEDTADAIRLLAQRARVIAEGAGAASLAAALRGEAEGKKVVCVVSGGNIDPEKLARIFDGETPD